MSQLEYIEQFGITVVNLEKRCRCYSYVRIRTEVVGKVVATCARALHAYAYIPGHWLTVEMNSEHVLFCDVAAVAGS